MKKLLLLAILPLALIACQSLPPEEAPQTIPHAQISGCKSYANIPSDYYSCREGMTKLWENRENATPTITVIGTKRYNDTWIQKTYQVCRLDLCDQFTVAERDETLWGKLKNGSILYLLGVVTGGAIQAGL